MQGRGRTAIGTAKPAAKYSPSEDLCHAFWFLSGSGIHGIACCVTAKDSASRIRFAMGSGWRVDDSKWL
jgi:hypothetical protein